MASIEEKYKRFHLEFQDAVWQLWKPMTIIWTKVTHKIAHSAPPPPPYR
jgi:hypothetical protein